MEEPVGTDVQEQPELDFARAAAGQGLHDGDGFGGVVVRRRLRLGAAGRDTAEKGQGCGKSD